MTQKTSIARLARELGQDPNAVLAAVRSSGEYVTSTRSPLEAPVVRRIRELFPLPDDDSPDDERAGPPAAR